MKMILTLIYSDLRQIFRDKTLIMFLTTPLFLILFIRFYVPYLTLQFPFVANYHTPIMMFGGVQTAIMFGFITAFIILDEKDENVLQVIRVLPISTFYFIVYRLTFATCFSALAAFLMIHFGGIAYPGFINSLLLSLQYGLAAPFIILIIATFANNKIEGMAFFKGVDLILLLPILFFYFSGAFRYVFVIIPIFWTYILYAESMVSGKVWLYFMTGLGVYSVVLFLLFYLFQKRVFNR